MSSTTSTLQMFTKFAQLPKELQLQIWHTPIEPRVLFFDTVYRESFQATFDSYGRVLAPGIRFFARKGTPISPKFSPPSFDILNDVCQQSRHVLRTRCLDLGPGLDNRLFNCQTSNSASFDPVLEQCHRFCDVSNDVLCISVIACSTTGGLDPFADYLPELTREIKKVAFWPLCYSVHTINRYREEQAVFALATRFASLEEVTFLFPTGLYKAYIERHGGEWLGFTHYATRYCDMIIAMMKLLKRTTFPAWRIPMVRFMEIKYGAVVGIADLYKEVEEEEDEVLYAIRRLFV